MVPTKTILLCNPGKADNDSEDTEEESPHIAIMSDTISVMVVQDFLCPGNQETQERETTSIEHRAHQTQQEGVPFLGEAKMGRWAKAETEERVSNGKCFY